VLLFRFKSDLVHPQPFFDAPQRFGNGEPSLMRSFACFFRGCLLLAVLLSFPGLRAATLIETNSVWRFFRGSASPSPADPAAWRQRVFDDANWESGPAAFHYGEPGFSGTELAGMQNSYTTVFLRKKFTVANPANVTALELTSVCDDGFVAYLNGQRVAAFRAPATEPVHTDIATSAEEYVWNTHDIASPAAKLVAGENVLAIVVLNGSPGSSDLVFDAELISTEATPEPPRIVGVTPTPGAVTNLTSITVTFSEPVTGVAAEHFLINDKGATSVSGSGTTYLFNFPQSPFGPVQITWGVLHGIVDLDTPPQRFELSAPGSAWAYELLDPAGPAVTLRQPPAGLTLKQLSEVEVTFNRAVTGLDAADLRLNGAAALGASGVGAGPYRFTFAPALAGNATLAWSAGHGITSDELEPHPFIGTEWSYTINPAQPAPLVVINELMAENAGSSKDEDTDPEDWIELHNRGTTPVNLQGWSLSNDRDEEGLWTFPAVTMPANGFLVVWASGKDRREPIAGRRLHTNFKLNPNGDTLRLFSPELPRIVVSEVPYPEQGPDFSYGRQGAGAGEVWRFFSPATPGVANGVSTVTGKVEEVHFSVERGYYDKPFVLSLACPTPDAIIRYTTNGSPPSLTNGVVYTEPLAIAASRVIRAAAFATNQLPSRVRTHTYLYGLAPNRRLLPALSLVTATNNLYGRTGIMEYNPRNTTFHGPAWERPVSVEFISPVDNDGFHIDAGIRVAGGDYIRGLYNYRAPSPPENKYSYRLYFRGEYGPGRLEYPIFPGTTVESFNSLHLRAGMNDNTNPLLKDEFVRALSDDVGLVACHGTFVSLFLNGVYKGIYNPVERVDDDFLQQYHGGGELWDVMGPNSSAVRGDTVAWGQLRTAARKDLTIRSNYVDVAARMDLPNFVDYLLPLIWADNDDWPHNNTRAAREKVPGAKFRFYPWDAEFAFGFSGHSVSYDTIATTLSTTSPPWGTTDYQQMFNALKRSYEFKLLFADRVHRAFYNGGPLTDPRIRARYNAMKAGLAPSIGGFSDVVGSWINGRHRHVTNIFQKAGFLASSNAPVLSRHGGVVPAGFALTLTNRAGTIYFTTDGVDPRVPFEGVPSASAKTYTAPLTLTDSVRLLSRSLNGTNWSALTEAEFTVADLGPTIRLSEIMFNPPGGDAYEFLELVNDGGIPVNLADFAFDGITFRFPNPFPLLAPGARLVLSSDANPAAFAARYPGVPVAGRFGGSLSNGGERLTLLDRAGRIVFSVSYDDEGAWPRASDGGGASLEISNLNADPDDPANWHASAEGGGTPGSANSDAPAPTIRLNEVFAENPIGFDWIEIHNPGPASANLGGWSLTDDNDPRKYVFPANTPLAAGGYLIVICDGSSSGGGLRSGFALDRDGETLALFNPTTNRVDAVTFGPLPAGSTLGRAPTAWVLCEPTPVGPNEVAALGEATAIKINEFLADSDGGDDWFELHNMGDKPVALQGSFLSTSNAVFRIGAPVFVGAGGFVTLKADEQPGPSHVDFKLTAAGDLLSLTDANGVELDRVAWNAQKPLVPVGRLPDGTGAFVSLPFSASPGASNYLAAPGSGLRFDEFMARNESGPLSPAGWLCDWIEIFNPTTNALALTGYSLSVGKSEPGEWPFPPGTTLAAGARLVVWASTNASVPGAISLGRGLRDAGTTLTLFDDRERLLDVVTFGPQPVNGTIGRTENGWLLLVTPTPGAVNSAAAQVGPSSVVRINEWLADGGTNSVDWFELHNPGTLPVSIGGHYLSDDPSISGAVTFVIPPLTYVGPGGYVQFFADDDTDEGVDHVNFQLDEFGETLRLYDPNRAIIDSVSFQTQVLGVTEGRFLDSSSLIVRFPASASPAAANWLPNTDRDGDGMPDPWEYLNLFNPDDTRDGLSDPDNDGASTASEFAAGTDPRNAASVLRLTIEMAANATVTVRFPTVDSRSYSVLYSDAPVGSQWHKLADVAATEPVGGVASVPDATPAAARPVRYYKVVTPISE
jgi:hypothetical protein